jgi:ethanolamine utilization microcompartment shell protein EutS
VPGLEVAAPALLPAAAQEVDAQQGVSDRVESVSVQLLTPGALAALSARLAATGCEVRELRPGGLDLEARFLALTGAASA